MFKVTSLYILGNILNKFISFLLLPILTYYIAPEGYGIISLVQIVISICTIFVSLNFNGAYLRYYFKYEKIIRSKLLYNIVFFTFMNFIIVLTVLLLFVLVSPYSVDELLYIDKVWIFVAVVIALSNSVMSLILVNFQISNSPIKYSLTIISYNLSNVCVSLFLIMKFNLGWRGRILGMFISSIVLVAIAIIQYSRKNPISLRQLDTGLKGQIYKFGLPLLPHALSGIFLVSVDRLFLNNMMDLASVGIYSTAYQFGILISVVASSINIVWSPYFFKTMEKNVSALPKIIARMFYIFLILLVVAIAIVFLSKILILNFFDTQYHLAVKYVGIITIGHLFEGMYILVSNFIFFYGKNIFLSYCTVTAVIVNVTLNYILISRFGLYGAVFATMIAYILYFSLVSLYSIYLIRKNREVIKRWSEKIGQADK